MKFENFKHSDPLLFSVLRDYDRMDYTDIGDNEADKLVQGVLHNGGAHQGHQH